MEAFLRDIFGDALATDRRLVIFTTPDTRARLFTDVDAATQYARARSDACDVYFGLALVTGQPKGRGTLEDTAAIGALWADIDVAGDTHPRQDLPTSIDEARTLLAALPVKPSIVVHSGHGLHAYWLLKEPWVFDTPEERQVAAQVTKGWHAVVCAAAAASGWHPENLGDLTRVLRLPGTLNRKDSANAAPVQILERHPDVRYTLDDFEPYLLPISEAPTTADPVDVTLRADAEPPATRLAEALLECLQFRQTWQRERPDLPDQSQSGYDLSLATIAALRGWTDQDIANLIIAARRRHDRNPAKALRPDYVRRTIERARAAASAVPAVTVDLSGLLPPAVDDEPQPSPGPPDPGPVPEESLRIPGFISEVMDFCLGTAPYPNHVLAFCGALVLQAFLAGRKVRDPGDNRTNLYVLGLAHSSAGKDAPRKLNAQIIHTVGLDRCLGERLASGEGIQDALFIEPTMLVQTDEIDGVLQSINRSRDARHESMMATLLTLYSASNSIYPMRRKAGKEYPGAIDQPCLVLLGTAIPAHYYGALSERMLTNGFFARMLILEASQRGEGQEPSIRELPPRILATAKWWADFQPQPGNLTGCHPSPTVVEQTDEARAVLTETRLEADSEYRAAEGAQDAVGTTVWGRVSEQARKLALLYAISESHVAPRIGVEAARWASQLVMHQARRMLFMAASHVAENPFHADCLRLLKKLRDAPDRVLPHQVLLKRMKIDAKSFRELIETLIQRGDISTDAVATGGRTRTLYRLAGEGSEGR